MEGRTVVVTGVADSYSGTLHKTHLVVDCNRVNIDVPRGLVPQLNIC